jgi:hypothetical protein
MRLRDGKLSGPAWGAEIWVAIDERGGVWATWFSGCSQPFRQWRENVLSWGLLIVRAHASARLRRPLIDVQRGKAGR